MSAHLTGQIHHIITSSSHDERINGKRPRPWETNNNSVDTKSSIKGFVFECHESSTNSIISSFGNVYQLVLPLSLTKMACRAASSESIVQLSQYSLICYRHGRGDVVFNSRDGIVSEIYNKEENGLDSCIMVAVVHTNGLTIDTEFETTHSQILETAITLQTLSTREQGKKRKKDPINLTATIDAISPIFIHDTERPFALIELYQPGTIFSAVAVVRGENALCMHPALHPGLEVTLVGVVSRSWKVAGGFCQRSQEVKDDSQNDFYGRLYRRTPDRVILVEDANTIHFNSHVLTTLPSTVDSLTCIRGVIDSVHYYRYEDARNKRTEDILHFITLKLSRQSALDESLNDTYGSDGNEIDTSPRVARLNVLKYSFSPNIMLGLQPGAVISAVNIHSITPANANEECFVACLRSTVSIESCATDTSDGSGCGPWFIPNSPSFNLVPNHRIAKICANACTSVPSTRYFEEDHLRLKAEAMINDQGDILRQVRVLLAHHYNTGTSSTSPTTRHNKSVANRDPYAEFFDHAHPDSLQLEHECGCPANTDFSKFLCHQDVPSANAPYVVRLNVLRDTCVQNFIQRMANYSRTNNSGPLQVSSGSTSSYHYYSSRVYLWGSIDLVGKNLNGIFFGYECKVPFSIPTEANSNAKHFKNPHVGWLRVKSALVSCLCLGRAQCQDEAKNSDESSRQTVLDTDSYHVYLPSAQSACTSNDTSGHNFVFMVGDLIFIGSIQLIATPVECGSVSSAHDYDNTSHLRTESAQPNEPALSIQDCLKQTCNDENEPSVSIVGRLIRQRFQYRKAKHTKFYEGWTITLSHIDASRDNSLTSSSFLQTIEVHVAVPIGSPSSSSDFLWNALKSALRELLQSCSGSSNGSAIDPLYRVSSDQLTMGLAFLHTSECVAAHPILCGGWESCNNHLFAEAANSSIKSTSLYVTIPITSREFSKLGYQRFRCCLGDIQSTAVMETFNVPESICPKCLFDFGASSKKFLPGMLSQRLCRMKSCLQLHDKRPIIGIENKNPNIVLSTLNHVVPSVSLLDLHYEICEVLRNKQPSCLHPSLLRRVHNAKILGISFCRARVECTQCFQFLTSSSHNSHNNDKALSCPSGCRSSHSAIKWECSAVIDDGTGQAKLYAEREAALLLIGSSLDVEAVEKGAWICQDGVFFQPALPPSSYLQRCLKEASLEARKFNTKKLQDKSARNSNEKPATAYDFITCLAKAEYILQQHCRQWYQNHHHRKLDLFCRCKPLSLDVTSVNCTEIQVAKAIDGCGLDFGSVHTCTLPPLKLILEDICLASENNQSASTTAWDMLRDFTRK